MKKFGFIVSPGHSWPRAVGCLASLGPPSPPASHSLGSALPRNFAAPRLPSPRSTAPPLSAATPGATPVALPAGSSPAGRGAKRERYGLRQRLAFARRQQRMLFANAHRGHRRTPPIVVEQYAS
eukprot:1791333-Pleurochrysis_carterae.AAC.1